MLVATSVLASAMAVHILQAPPVAAQDFDNARIADAGLRELGAKRPTGWNQPGECVKSVQRWVSAADGTLNSGGPVSGYTSSGATEVPLSSAVKGDIVQYTSNTNPNGWEDGVHTLVIVQNYGDGRFHIVQSNVPAGSGLVTEDKNWTSRPPRGFSARVWRLGKVNTQPTVNEGSFVRKLESGMVFRITGGHPVRLYNCGPVGCHDGNIINMWGPQVDAIANAQSWPREGTFVRRAETGQVLRIAGGAPIPLYNCGPVGCHDGNIINLNSMSVDDLARRFSLPQDYTFIRRAETGQVLRMVGGTAVGLTDCGPLGCHDGNIINLNSMSVDYIHNLRWLPADKTFVRRVETMQVYRVAGGSPVPLYDCGPVNCQNIVDINSMSVDELFRRQSRPRDGAFLRKVETLEVFQMQNGRPVKLSDCSAFGCTAQWLVDVNSMSIDYYLK
mgnify:CR=1 FL=1